MMKATEKVCGYSKSYQWHQQTWWWNDAVDAAVCEKRRCYPVWKKGGSRAEYNKALGIDDKTAAWKEHYERLSNVEFDWDPTLLSEEPPVEGPAPDITLEQVIKAIRDMKVGKAAGPSQLVAEMLKASGETGAVLIRDLVTSIARDGKIPSDWEESFIVSLYKGKGAALERGNYRGLKLLDQVMKVYERIVESHIRQQVSIDDMQFGFMPGRGTTDAIFIIRQLQEKYLAARKSLYMAFVDLEKAFDRVPRRVIWWSLRKLGCEEWLVTLVQGMYENARSRVRVGDGYSDEFSVKVGVHQGSCLSPLLFIIVLEALSREFRTGCPWEDLYADDLVIIAESREVLCEKLQLWKNEMEGKGLRVNMGKTKVMVSGRDMDVLKKSGKDPCAVCLTGTGRNSILCGTCSRWVHKKCSGIPGKLTADSEFSCKRCRGEARPIDGRPEVDVVIDGDPMEVVGSFCYLGDTLSSGGGCGLATITRCQVAWKKFHQLLPILTSRYLTAKTKGRVYNTCIRSAMLHASETWALPTPELNRLRRNDKAMIRWMCGVSTKDDIRSDSLLQLMGLDEIDTLLRRRRLRCAGHVERSDGPISRVRQVSVAGRNKGRPIKSWEEVIRHDKAKLGLEQLNPRDRYRWRRELRSSVRQDPPCFVRD